MGHDLYKNLGDIDMCREFDMFKVNVRGCISRRDSLVTGQEGLVVV